MKYFVYELKKNRALLVLLTVLASALYVVVCSTYELFYIALSGRIVAAATPIGTVYTFSACACAIVPIIVYSFKMKKRSVDVFYSLPLKREKIWLAKTLVGLVLVIVPYTVAYWLGFTVIAARENYYDMIYFLSGFFGGALYIVCMFGIFSFTFTRANNVADGVVFIILYTFAGMFFTNFINAIIDAFGSSNDLYIDTLSYCAFGGLIDFGNMTDSLLRGVSDAPNVAMFLFPVLYAAVCYTLMFVLVRCEKAENAEQRSETWFGYRTMLPAYLVMLLAVTRITSVAWLAVLVIIVAVVMSAVYKRSVRMGARWAIVLGVCSAAGVLLGIVLHL